MGLRQKCGALVWTAARPWSGTFAPTAAPFAGNAPLEINLRDELDAVRQYNNAVEACTEAGDSGSKVLFDSMIRDEERHADFLEAQLSAIKELGIANYLAFPLGGK
jgi:hypothetical protein